MHSGARLLAVAGLLLGSLQGGGCAPQYETPGVEVDLSGLGTDPAPPPALRAPFTASSLIGKPVFGATGRPVGRVADLIIGRGGELRDVIVEPSGFPGFKGERFAVPIELVEVTGDFAGLKVPVKEETVGQAFDAKFGLGGDPALADIESTDWIASELIGRRIEPPNAAPGVVTDLVLEDAVVNVVVVRPGAALPPYGLPLSPGVNPSFRYYRIPASAWGQPIDLATLKVSPAR